MNDAMIEIIQPDDWHIHLRQGEILKTVSQETTKISSMVFIILIGASMFSLVFRGFGGDIVVEEFLMNLPGGAISAMLIVMAIIFFLGFFLL